MSRTVIVKLPLAVFRAPSVAEHVTVVVPKGNIAPEATEHVTATLPLTRSVAAAVKVTNAPEGAVASVRIFAGSESSGLKVSTIVTMKLPDTVFPKVSVAEQFTVVIPSGKIALEKGEHEGVMALPLRSVAVAV